MYRPALINDGGVDAKHPLIRRRSATLVGKAAEAFA
jgi:hypothetical protein